MKLKLCLVTLFLSATLVACSSKNESVDLYAPVAGTEELASQEQTQEKIDENNQEETNQEETNETLDEDSTNNETQLAEFNSEEEKLAHELIQNSIADHGYAKEQQEIQSHSTEEGIAQEEQAIVTNIPTITGTPTVTNAPTSTMEPTQVPSVSIHPSTAPTSAPDATIKPSNTPEPTKAPSTTIKPTITPEPTKAPGATIKPSNTPIPTKAPVVTVKPTSTPVPTKTPVKPTSTPTPTKEPSQTSSAVLNVRGTTIKMGESKSSIIDKFGSPSRIDETEYNYEFYVYPGNYKNFMMIGIANNKVVAWYTDSTDFSYQGLTTSSKVSSINSTFGKSLSLKNTLSLTDDGNSITFFMDTIGDSTIEGVYVADSSVSKGSTTKSVLTAWEKEVLDLTNSFRVRNGLSSLTWSSEASTSARLHSEDMAKNNYFSHTGLDGSTPYDRMKAQGISYKSAGENIIGGYGNAMFSNNGWVNSSGHRKNMLNSSFNYLGVGFALGGTYGNYGTQNFFGK